MVKHLLIPESTTFEAVRRRVARYQRDKLVLELPEGWLELDTVARMRLLQRQAQIQENDLALVTRHSRTQQAARQVGIPTFTKLDDAVKGRWRMDPLLPLVDPADPAAGLPEAPPWRRDDVVAQRSRPTQFQARTARIAAERRYRRELPWWMRLMGPIAAGLLVAVLLTGFLLYILPAATVTLVPGRAPLSVTTVLTADADLDVSDLDEDILAARLLETTIEQRGAIATTGSQQKPSVNAVGEVVFSNLGNTPVRIPTGTEVSTASGTPVRFRTTREVELGSGVGERVTAPVQAVEPGIQGNVRANTINTVGGALRFRARVSNPTGTFGGGSELVSVVTQGDQENLAAQMRAAADAIAYERLVEELEAGEWLDPESVQTFVIAQVFDQFKDDEATELGLTLRVLVQGVAVGQNQIEEAMLRELQEAIPSQGRLVVDTVRFSREPGVSATGRTVEFTMTANADYVVPIDPDEVRRTVTGQTPDAAAGLLQEKWRLSSTPEIYQDPAWLGVLPRFPNRIQVRIEYAGALAAQ